MRDEDIFLYAAGRYEKLCGAPHKRKSINKRKIFPNDQSALKVIYLAIQKASMKWTMSLHDWRAAMSRFVIEFMAEYLK